MDLITITLHDGESPAQHITVGLLDAIQTLQVQIPAGGRRWIIFRGSLIMAAFSFRHHGIKDGDDLYVIRPKPSAKIRSSIASRNDKSLLREAARLSDLTKHRALIHASAIDKCDEEAEVQVPGAWETILKGVEALGEPSTEPLPTSWK
jgi:hypothetical protein